MKNGLGNNEISQQDGYEIAMKCPKGNNEKMGWEIMKYCSRVDMK